MSADLAGTAEELLTLDELTARLDIGVRTVRFYTTRGLLPPPIRRGRSGFYSRDHVARLELIRDLQAHGFTLAAIETYLQRLGEEATPEQVALQRVMLQPWLVEEPVLMSGRELARMAGRPLDEGTVAKLTALGILSPSGRDRYAVVTGHLTNALQLIDLGTPLEVLQASQAIFTRHGREIAEELGSLFRSTLWSSYKEGGISLEQMTALLEAFKPVSVAALVEAYTHAMTEAKKREIARRAQ